MVSYLSYSKRGKLDAFIRGLRLDIAKKMMMLDNPPKNFSKALDQALRYENIRQRMARDKELSK